jgi:hypothetical protein
VSTAPALSALNSIWNEVMQGIELWLNTFGYSDFSYILEEVNQSKDMIIEAVAVEIEHAATVTAATFKAAVVDAIESIVPAATTLLPLPTALEFALLVWDVMNWDVFVLKVY